MSRIGHIHEDYLDPDKHLWPDDPPILENGIPEKNAICPACGETAEWFRNVDPGGFPSDLVGPELESEGWHCAECDWEQETDEYDYENKAAYDEKYKDRLNAVKLAIAQYNRRIANHDYPFKTSVDDIFEYFPEHNFEYDGTKEFYDWEPTPWLDEDKGRSWWRTSMYVEIVKREAGKRSIEFWAIDADGDADCVGGWAEGDDWETSEGPRWYGCMMSDYFRNWAEYWIDCFYSGEDPLDQIMSAPNDWLGFCLDAAEDNAKCLNK